MLHEAAHSLSCLLEVNKEPEGPPWRGFPGSWGRVCPPKSENCFFSSTMCSTLLSLQRWSTVSCGGSKVSHWIEFGEDPKELITLVASPSDVSFERSAAKTYRAWHLFSSRQAGA